MKNVNNIKGEVAGFFLIGISQSFANLNIFTENILKENIGTINPTKWYPYHKLIELLNYVKTNYHSESKSILFRAGINFINIWYNQGPGKNMIFSGLDWIYANSESQGYNSVVRGGNKSDIGWCNIKTIDEKKGIVVYENVTPLPSDLVKGIFYGGCFLFDDMEYVYIESTEEDFQENPIFLKIILTLRFRVKSKNKSLHLESKINKMQFDNILKLSSDEYESLIWQYKYLKYENEINQEYFREMSKILSDVTNKSILQSKKLEELNATKDKLFSIIAHDLKSPFNTLLGLSEILLKNHKNFDDKKREDIIKGLNKSARNAFILLENLLTWSLSQSDGIKYSPVVLNLEMLLSKVISQLQAQADKKSIFIVNAIQKTATVYGDNNMTEIILRNLISNSIKFTMTDGKVIISCIKQKNSNFIEISVADTGVGIPKSIINDLFHIGKISSTHGTAKENGTGLGLIVCKEFVEKQGGKIWVESELDKGSVFKFTMPAHNNL